MSSHSEPNPTANQSAPVVLVTGVAKRLGREIALTLAKHGWQVAVHYRSSKQDAINTIADLATNTPATGQKHHIFQCDLADEAATRALVPSVIQHFGRLDAVVNSAAAFEYDSAQSFSYSALQKHMASNTGAAILLAQALHAHIEQRQLAGDGSAKDEALTTPRGVVVNMLDQKLWNQNPDFFSYRDGVGRHDPFQIGCHIVALQTQNKFEFQMLADADFGFVPKLWPAFGFVHLTQIAQRVIKIFFKKFNAVLLVNTSSAYELVFLF